MAHFAEIDDNNVVLRVIVVNNNELMDDNSVEQESLGQAFCQSLFDGNWVQTSYNGSFRKNFAGVGYTYDQERNAFIPPKAYSSWVLNETTCQWEAPIPLPDSDSDYIWDEDTTSWIEVT